MNWLEVSVYTSQEAIEAVSYQMQELGANGVSIEDPEVLQRKWVHQYGEIFALSPDDYPTEGVRIKAYLPEHIQIEPFVEQLKMVLAKLVEYGLDSGRAEIEVNTVQEESWANEWKKYYKPIQITPQLTVKPTWVKYTPANSTEKVIALDPKMAFGTGTHPTTILSLQLIEKYLKVGDRVIDVGCGSGILSIAAAKLGAKEVLALDLDPIAVESTDENSQFNQVATVIKVKQGDLLKGVSQTAEVVVSNILAEIILKFTHELSRVLVPGGIFIASGIIEQKADQVLSSLTQLGLQVLETIDQEGWIAIVAKKW